MAYEYGTNTGSLLSSGGKNNKDYRDYISNNLQQDYKGNNELGNSFRRAGFGLTPDLLNRVGFLNEIGPQRLEAIRGYINMFSPGQMQAMASQNQARLMQQGNQAALQARARLAGMGASQDAQAGAALAAQNQAQMSSNAYQNQLYSPEGQMQIFQGLMGAYGQAQDIGLQNLLPLFQAIEQRHVQNQNEKSQGGVLGGALGGVLGNVLPGLNWSGIFKQKASGTGNTAVKGHE
jgi:hypothetical protein